jgi:hypothetical protein
MSNCTVAALDWFVRHSLSPWNPPKDTDIRCPMSTLEEFQATVMLLFIVAFVIFYGFDDRMKKIEYDVTCAKADILNKQDKPPKAHECRCDQCDKRLE